MHQEQKNPINTLTLSKKTTLKSTRKPGRILVGRTIGRSPIFASKHASISCQLSALFSRVETGIGETRRKETRDRNQSSRQGPSRKATQEEDIGRDSREAPRPSFPFLSLAEPAHSPCISFPVFFCGRRRAPMTFFRSFSWIY